jgi:CRISPR system Cascade subunit CasA
MTTAHDLIAEPLLSWRDTQRQCSMTTLPGILAKLASGGLSDLPRVRAHQFHPWCMFLTQLAAIALHRANKADPPVSEDAWRLLLLGLTDGAREPWSLVVEDLSKPAFFQPPVPEGDIESWSRCQHPDDIDVLVTSKNHDVKRSLVFEEDLEAWALALVSLQTMQGYSGGGGGYRGIARMNRGYGSRACVGCAPDLTIGGRFSRDVRVLLDAWEGLLQRGFSENGRALVWTAAWDGNSSLSMSDLAPHFIEVCRRVRCRSSANAIFCAFSTSVNRRCLPEVENGDVGDAWIPVNRENGQALTVGRRGFHYELLERILFDFAPAPAEVIRADDGDSLVLLASVMARGQGKTDGLHDRVLPLLRDVRRRLGQPHARKALAKRANDHVLQAKKMRTRVLFPALNKLSLGNETVPDEFDARVDEIFFDDLFATLEQADDEVQLGWDRRLRDVAWAELQRAIDRCCIPSARWYRAVTGAEGMFHGCLKKQFPTLVASLETGALQGTAA